MTRWDDDRGFGFLEPTSGGRRVFVHVSAFPSGLRPRVGTEVVWVEGRDDRGRPQAVGVRRGPRGLGWARAVVAVVLLALGLGAGVATGRLPPVVPVACLVLSVLTAGVYAADKAAARQGRWRTAESTLHLLALVGGWPGALLARQALRHKTRKQPFTTVLWLTVLLDVAALTAYALRP